MVWISRLKVASISFRSIHFGAATLEKNTVEVGTFTQRKRIISSHVKSTGSILIFATQCCYLLVNFPATKYILHFGFWYWALFAQKLGHFCPRNYTGFFLTKVRSLCFILIENMKKVFGNGKLGSFCPKFDTIFAPKLGLLCPEYKCWK